MFDAMFEPPERFSIADYFLVDRLREGRGGRVALRTDDETLTYEQVDALANSYGHRLAELGVRQENRVLVALPDGPAFVGAFFGALKLGAVVVMVNPELSPTSLETIVGYARAPVAVVEPDRVPGFQVAAADAGRALALLVADDVEPGSLPLEVTATHRDDPAVWLFSGGTTGRPKAVVQPHRSFANTTECYAKQALGYSEDDVTISVPKLYFGYGTGSNLLFPFAVGGSTVLFHGRPTPAGLAERIARHRATILVNVPKMVAEMVDDPAAGDADLSSLRLATSAGEALPPGLHDRWRRTFGVELLDGLGTAEMWHIFCSNLPGDVHPGTLGRAVPGFEVAVRDPDGRDLPDGQVGHLWVRGGSRAIGYWQNLPATAQAFRGEWFVGGDLVRRNADGTIGYVGRGDDAMKVGGKWVLTAEVEYCLAEHPAVGSCAVVGAADGSGLTKPVAFVVAADPPAGLEEHLRRHVLDRLEPYKAPRAVLLVDDLPRTHLGKVDRSRLRQLAEASDAL